MVKIQDSIMKEGGVLLSLPKYIEEINLMVKNGPWRIPFGFMDKLHFMILSFFVKFSWFSDKLYIEVNHEYGPAYAVIISYLQKKGLISDVNRFDLHSSDYYSYFSKKKIYINEGLVFVTGQGVSQSKEEALSKSLGEIMERTISGIFDLNKKIIKSSVNEIIKKGEIVYPPKFHRFLKRQTESYRELLHTPDNMIEWVEGVNLVNKKKTYIPRQMTSWFGFGVARVLRDKLVQSTSNGCAGYFTKEGAVLRALLEVVGRDGFFVHYLTKIAPSLICIETIPSEFQDIINSFKEKGFVLYILDVTSLDIPAVIIVTTNPDDKVRRIVLSGSCATTFYEAIEQGLREMVGMLENFYISLKPFPYQKYTPFCSSLDKQERQRYWSGEAEIISQFNWFISGSEITYQEACKRNISDSFIEKDKLNACLNILQKFGDEYLPIVYFPKNEIQKHLGFYIAQVFIPKAFPLYLDECYGTFDSERLKEFAASKGVFRWNLNETPHPFL